MTKQEYLSEHGEDFRKFSKKDAFTALLRMIDDEGPSRKLTKLSETDKLNGSAVFLNKISGWEELRELLSTLTDQPKESPEPPDKFSEPEL